MTATKNQKSNYETTWQLHKDFEDIFNGIDCFDGTFYCS